MRDKALKIYDEIPKSDVGKEYYQQNLEREVCDDRILHINRPRVFARSRQLFVAYLSAICRWKAPGVGIVVKIVHREIGIHVY